MPFVLALALVPTYVSYLGIEAYGLVGFGVTIQALFLMFDWGLAPTIARDVASHSAVCNASADPMRNKMRTSEVIIVAMALSGIAVVSMSAEWIAHSWLTLKSVSLADATRSIILIGILSALRLVEGLYRAALMGQQKHVYLNVTTVIISVFRWCGSVAVLAYYSPTIVAFFEWQLIASAISLFITAVGVYKHVPFTSRKGKIALSSLRDRYRFASGMAVNAVFAFLLTQGDRIILSRALTLTEFAYYCLALTVASVVGQISGPISHTFYPHITSLTVNDRRLELLRVYHLASQVITVAVVPFGYIVALFSPQIMLLWTGDEELSKNVSLIVAILLIANTIHSLTAIPNTLRLALGMAWWAVGVNVCTIVILFPAMIWASYEYGAPGAACVWLAVGLGYLLVDIPILHRQILKGESCKWFVKDLLSPTASAVLVVSAVFLLAPFPDTRVYALVYLISICAAAMVVATLVCTELRDSIWRFARALLVSRCTNHGV